MDNGTIDSWLIREQVAAPAVAHDSGAYSYSEHETPSTPRMARKGERRHSDSTNKENESPRKGTGKKKARAKAYIDDEAECSDANDDDEVGSLASHSSFLDDSNQSISSDMGRHYRQSLLNRSFSVQDRVDIDGIIEDFKSLHIQGGEDTFFEFLRAIAGCKDDVIIDILDNLCVEFKRIDLGHGTNWYVRVTDRLNKYVTVEGEDGKDWKVQIKDKANGVFNYVREVGLRIGCWPPAGNNIRFHLVRSYIFGFPLPHKLTRIWDNTRTCQHLYMHWTDWEGPSKGLISKSQYSFAVQGCGRKYLLLRFGSKQQMCKVMLPYIEDCREEAYVIPLTKEDYEVLLKLLNPLQKIPQMTVLDLSTLKKLKLGVSDSLPFLQDFLANIFYRAANEKPTDYMVNTVIMEICQDKSHPLNGFCQPLNETHSKLRTAIKTSIEMLSSIGSNFEQERRSKPILSYLMTVFNDYDTYKRSYPDLNFIDYCNHGNGIEHFLMQQEICPMTFATVLFRACVTKRRREKNVIFCSKQKMCGKSILANVICQVFNGTRININDPNSSEFKLHECPGSGIAIFDDITGPTAKRFGAANRPELDGDKLIINPKFKPITSASFPPILFTTNDEDIGAYFEFRAFTFNFPKTLHDIYGNRKVESFSPCDLLRLLCKYTMYPLCSALYNLPKSHVLHCDRDGKIMTHSNCRMSQYIAATPFWKEQTLYPSENEFRAVCTAVIENKNKALQLWNYEQHCGRWDNMAAKPVMNKASMTEQQYDEIVARFDANETKFSNLWTWVTLLYKILEKGTDDLPAEWTLARRRLDFVQPSLATFCSRLRPHNEVPIRMTKPSAEQDQYDADNDLPMSQGKLSSSLVFF